MSYSVIAGLVNVIYMPQIQIRAASAACQLLHVYVIRNVFSRFRNTCPCSVVYRGWYCFQPCLFVTLLVRLFVRMLSTGYFHGFIKREAEFENGYIGCAASDLLSDVLLCNSGTPGE